MPDSGSVVLGPKLGAIVYCDIGGNISNSLRALLRSIDALVQASVLSAAIATPPGSPANGDAYIVAASPTGAWAGQQGNIAVWSTQIATTDTNTKVPAWEFHAPKAGWLAYNAATSQLFLYSGTSWAALATGGGGGAPNLTTQTVSYTALVADFAILMNSASATTVTLQTSSYSAKQQFRVKNISTGVVTITPSTGTIDGNASISLSQYQSVDIEFDGTNYWLS